jgi:hypothetical protein
MIEGVGLLLKRVLALGVILALVGAGCGSGGRLDARAMLLQSKSVQSQAAEGALLAQDAVAGKTTRIFMREHASALHKAAAATEASLRAATTEPALEPSLRQLTGLAGHVSADLERLAGASESEQRSLTRDLQAAAQASQRIGEGLT